MRLTGILMLVALLTGANYKYPNKTAEQVATYCASHGLRHIGGNHSYEGLGCASTPEAAYKGCCFGSRKDLITYDSAIVKASNGLYVACRRYVSKSNMKMIDEYRKLSGLPPAEKDDDGNYVLKSHDFDQYKTSDTYANNSSK